MNHLECLYFIRETLLEALPASWWGGKTVIPPEERPSRAKNMISGIRFENGEGDQVWVHVYGKVVVNYQGRVWSFWDKYPVRRRPMGKARARRIRDLVVLFLTLDDEDQTHFLDVRKRNPDPGPPYCLECDQEVLDAGHEDRCLAGLEPDEALAHLHALAADNR